MTNILGNSTSALLAFQRALATTSHNIANSATEGFTRQRVELVNRPGPAPGGEEIAAVDQRRGEVAMVHHRSRAWAPR